MEFPLDAGALASFGFTLGGHAQTPLHCPSDAWEFPSSSGTASAYVLLGSSLPFSAQGGHTIQDEGSIPWPAGVSGSEGATTMQLAQIDIDSSCRPVAPLWL